MSDLTNFDRQYRILAGPAGGSGFTIGDTDGGKAAPLHINFALQRSDLCSANTGRVTIWNLNDAHLAILNKENCVVSVKAGYGERIGHIFTGFVTCAYTSMDGADRMTEIDIADHLIQLRETYVTVSYKGTVSWKTIVDDTAAKLGVAVLYAHDVTFSSVTNGFSFVGPAREILNKAVASNGLAWNLQNGVLHIKRANGTMNLSGYLISAETGMIGLPVRFREAATEEGQSDIVGWEVTYLMNGSINIGDYVRLESKMVKGYFGVYTIEYSGDNLAGDWYCKARLVEVG